MILSHLPALVIVIPLICAPLCVLLRRKDWAFSVALIATWASFACACLIAEQVMDGSVISYEMGGWPPRPGGLDAAIPLVPVEVVRSLTVAGTPEQCVAGVRAYMTKPNIYPALLPITENYEPKDRVGGSGGRRWRPPTRRTSERVQSPTLQVVQ